MAAPQHQMQQAAIGMGGNGGNRGGSSSVKMAAGYVLQQRVGSGSFATVYKGVKTVAGRTETAAIKAISRTSEKLTKKVLDNLELEISILRTYQHPNIVCLKDVQKTDRHFFLVLEFCGGGDVQRLIRTRKSGRITERLARRLMRDLSSGLKFLWSQELIHRDIKPQNLLLTGPLPLDEVNDPSKLQADEDMRSKVNFPSSQFALKIADFGFARHLQTASLAETLCGSPLYMAPEILQHHRYDAKADLWSVGTVLFEMIAGRPPFHGENHIDLLRNIQRKAVRLPPDVSVSKECVTLLRLLLSRNPISRAGFKEFFEACDAFVALGCEGEARATNDEGTTRLRADLGTISETDDNDNAASMVAAGGPAPVPQHSDAAEISTQTQQRQFQHQPPREAQQRPQYLQQYSDNASVTQKQPSQENVALPGKIEQLQVHQGAEQLNLVSPQLRPVAVPPMQALHPSPASSALAKTSNYSTRLPHSSQHQKQMIDLQRQNSHFTPLEPSPPGPGALGAPGALNALPPPLSLGAGAQARAVPTVIPPSTHVIGVPGQTRMLLPPRQEFDAAQQYQNALSAQRKSNSSSQSSEEGGFVMVERVIGRGAGDLGTLRQPTHQPDRTGQRLAVLQNWRQSAQSRTHATSIHPPRSMSPRYFGGRIVPTSSANVPQQHSQSFTKGILATSPGAGGALVGMMETPPPEAQPPASIPVNAGECAAVVSGSGARLSGGSGRSFNNEFPSPSEAAKTLAAAEDVGRRAVNVAHLGDTRAFLAMKLIVSHESASSLLTSAPMEGVEEEDETEESVNRRTRIISTDRGSVFASAQEEQVEDDREDDEMPFAVSTDGGDGEGANESVLSVTAIPSRQDGSTVVNSTSMAASKLGGGSGKATPMQILSHFREALSCYIKALSMLKGAVNAAHKMLTERNESNSPISEAFRKRSEISHSWLAGQFSGVLERADAANAEVTKLQANILQQGSSRTSSIDKSRITSVEELIYNHSLACGREGAVKQLLGQFEAARSCYRSAGLLAETLLMDPRLGEEDRRVLEEYVHGFAERITELDSVARPRQSASGINTPIGNSNSAPGSRRGSGVIGVPQPKVIFMDKK